MKLVRRLKLFPIFTLFYSLSMNMQAADVEDVRVWHAPDHIRLVFDLSETFKYNLFSLDGPDRIVIDIDDSELSGNFNNLDFSDSSVDRIRSAVRNGNTLRVVLTSIKQ